MTTPPREIDDGVVLGGARPRLATVEQERDAIRRMLAEFLAYTPRYAYSLSEAAEKLGVSPEFFEQHITPELRCIRRGRRRLFPAVEILGWLWRAAD